MKLLGCALCFFALFLMGCDSRKPWLTLVAAFLAYVGLIITELE